MICVGAVFVVVNVFNIYNNIFGDESNGVVLLKYTIQNKLYTIMKREVKRSIYIQILLFGAHGVYVMCVDKSMELMVFATGNVYKRDIASLLGCNNEGIRKRIKWAQCFTLIFFTLAILSFTTRLFINDNVFYILTFIFVGLGLASFSVIYYGNVSLRMAKRLLKEPIVIIVLVLAFCNFAIEIAKPAYSLSPIMGLLYMQITTAYVFLDSIVWKDRYFVIFLGTVFVFLHARNLYSTTLGDTDYGIVLFKYKIGDNRIHHNEAVDNPIDLFPNHVVKCQQSVHNLDGQNYGHDVVCNGKHL